MTEKMLGVGLVRDKKGVHLFEIDKPELKKPTDVLVRIKENGVCGTDTNMSKHDYKDIAENRNEIVLGHEMMGVVEQVGETVSGFKPGDHVTMTVRRPCGKCAPCNSGRSDFCQTGLFEERGIHKLDGFLTQYVVDDQQWIVKVPRGLERYGSMAEPLSVVYKAIEQARYVQQRMPWSCLHKKHSWLSPQWGQCKNGVVLGVGPIGFLAAALMRLGGMEVTVISRSESKDPRVKLVRKLGCEYRSTSESAIGKIGQELSDNKRIDFLFEAAGASEAAFRMVPFLSRGGTCVLTGIPRGELKLSLEANTPASASGNGEGQTLDTNLLMRQITRHSLALIGSVNSNRKHFEKALASVKPINKAFPGALDQFVSLRVPLREYAKAFEAEKIMKAVVEIR